MASCSFSSGGASSSVAGSSVPVSQNFTLGHFFDIEGVKDSKQKDVVRRLNKLKTQALDQKIDGGYPVITVGEHRFAVLLESKFKRSGEFKKVYPAVDLDSADGPLQMGVRAWVETTIESTKRVLWLFKKKISIEEQKRIEENIKREADLLGACQGPSTVEFYQKVELIGRGREKKIGMLMEWCLTTLGNIIDMGASGTSWDEKLSCAQSLVEILLMLKQQGIYFRDLKPCNLLIDSEGRLKLADFGLAVKATEGYSSFAGTVPYFAPEYVLNRIPLREARAWRDRAFREGDAESIEGAHAEVTRLEKAGASCQGDVWAAGLILYELFYGKHPFVGQSGQDYIGGASRKQEEDEHYDRLSSAEGHRAIEAQLEALFEDKLKEGDPIAPIMRRMLHLNPEERITPESLMEEIQRIDPLHV